MENSEERFDAGDPSRYAGAFLSFRAVNAEKAVVYRLLQKHK
jgi:hypothetical protein